MKSKNENSHIELARRYVLDEYTRNMIVFFKVLQCVAVCCSVLQCVAVCCSVVECVAVFCSILNVSNSQKSAIVFTVN